MAYLHGRVDCKAAILAGLLGDVVFLMVKILLAIKSDALEARPQMTRCFITSKNCEERKNQSSTQKALNLVTGIAGAQ